MSATPSPPPPPQLVPEPYVTAVGFVACPVWFSLSDSLQRLARMCGCGVVIEKSEDHFLEQVAQYKIFGPEECVHRFTMQMQGADYWQTSPGYPGFDCFPEERRLWVEQCKGGFK